MKKVLVTLLFLLVSMMQLFCVAYAYRWDNPQNIKVFIHYSPNLDMKPLMEMAFKTWMQATKNNIKFRFQSYPKNSDIEVKFVDSPSKMENEKAAGITQYSYYPNSNILHHAVITISINDLDGEKFDDGILYGSMIHEIGHAIGLTEHSQNVKSVMYPYTVHNVEQSITQDDLNRLKTLYGY